MLVLDRGVHDLGRRDDDLRLDGFRERLGSRDLGGLDDLRDLVPDEAGLVGGDGVLEALSPGRGRRPAPAPGPVRLVEAGSTGSGSGVDAAAATAAAAIPGWSTCSS